MKPQDEKPTVICINVGEVVVIGSREKTMVRLDSSFRLELLLYPHFFFRYGSFKPFHRLAVMGKQSLIHPDAIRPFQSACKPSNDIIYVMNLKHRVRPYELQQAVKHPFASALPSNHDDCHIRLLFGPL